METSTAFRSPFLHQVIPTPTEQLQIAGYQVMLLAMLDASGRFVTAFPCLGIDSS